MSRVELYERIRKDSRDEGLSIRGLAQKHRVHRRTVREALALPEPKVSWMEPWPRERFCGWLQQGDLRAAA